MTKKLIVGIIVMISLALIVGYLAGSQHIPFTKSINLIYTQNFSSDSERFEKIDPILMETNIESLINIENTGDLEKKRIQLINFIWKSNSLQNSEMPEKIINNIDDPRFSEIKNLERIDKIIINMEYGVNSYPYLFHPVEKNNKLLIYHQGHAGDFILGKKTISYFIDKGYTVMAFSMPLYGSNNSPSLELENFGIIKFDSHNKLRFLDSKDFSATKLFFHPIMVSLNYAEQNYNFETFDMIGLSGGAWTITLYSAMDERISKIFPVGGPLPHYITQNEPDSHWHYEGNNLSLYRIANYLEIFIMSSYGENKEHVKILNKFDSCCYSGIGYTTFEENLQDHINMLGQGRFVVYLDETHSDHIISDFSLKLIEKNLN